MADEYVVVDKELFDHIKSGGPCPFTDRLISEFQADFDSRVHNNHGNMSSLLVQILDVCHGTEEIVSDKRKLVIMNFNVIADDDTEKWFCAGSRGEGFSMKSSDSDMMVIKTTVVVTYPDQIHLIPRDSLHKTILLIREADSRPGYVTLELSKLADGEGSTAVFQNAIVPFRGSLFVSSDIYRQGTVDSLNVQNDGICVSNGPCFTFYGCIDVADAFSCVCWPREANEWIHRTRLHGWPTQTVIDRIVHDGCHIVPVGDKCSTDTLLQWRISFACAERLLIHSLTHPQFRVYGLLKYFLTQIKESLDNIIGDSDILCSYFLKTIIFYAVEHSPVFFWNEQNTFICFRFCMSILIAWVRSGYCPNYFIRNNNMFLRKVHGENSQKLLHLLIDLFNLKWMCLSIESVNVPRIGLILQQHQRLVSRLPLPECPRDMILFLACYNVHVGTATCLYKSLKCLQAARTDVDEFIAYVAMVGSLIMKACDFFNEYNTTRSNKQKYIALKKCKQVLTPFASMCTSPGLMILATIHYLTGDYRRTLQMCADMMLTYRLSTFIDVRKVERSPHYYEPYQRLYCGKGYTYLEKLRGVCFCVIFNTKYIMLCPSHLHLEVTKAPLSVSIPPLPYAIFLSFLCYHDLGDLRRRDTELINLRAANYHPEQGGHKHWIVHTLLGICYQTVGDNRMAIRSYTDSLRVQPTWNPARERIEALRRCQ